MIAETPATSESDRALLARYRVELLPVDQINPSPENDEVYGAIDEFNDPELPALMRSIDRLGLEEPLILSKDGFILSGHRRYQAVKRLGRERIPVRYSEIRRSDCNDYHRLLAQYNPQRVKSAATSLVESFLNDDEKEDQPFWEFQATKAAVPAEFEQVGGSKDPKGIGPRREEFLAAAVRAVNELKRFWPLTVRQVHYVILNYPPLKDVTKTRQEKSRYRNDESSYKALGRLLTDGRYSGAIPWEAIDDETRATEINEGYPSVDNFIRQDFEQFLRGYQLDRQIGQPHHVECLLEKKTLKNICRPICQALHVPMTALGGFAGPSVWKHIENRYWLHHDAAGKADDEDRSLIIVVLSDHDPEGFNLADDACRSLRNLHGLPVEMVRAGVTKEQVREINAQPNPAKESSSRLAEYIKRHGSKDTWECESLPAELIQQELHKALIDAMDIDQLKAVQEREQAERKQLVELRNRFGEFLKNDSKLKR